MAAPKERSIGFAQFLAIIGVAVIVFLGWDFGRRVLTTMNLLDQDAQASVKLQQLEQQNADLTELKSQVTTDAWVERQVRRQWHWVRENEVPFVPIATPVPTPELASPPTTAAPPAKPAWQQWLDSLTNALFGPAS